MASAPDYINPSEITAEVVEITKPAARPTWKGPGPMSDAQVRAIGFSFTWVIHAKIISCKTFTLKKFRTSSTLSDDDFVETAPAYKNGDLVWLNMNADPGLNVGDFFEARTPEYTESCSALVKIIKKSKR
jgi:hypothetical protein